MSSLRKSDTSKTTSVVTGTRDESIDGRETSGNLPTTPDPTRLGRDHLIWLGIAIGLSLLLLVLVSLLDNEFNIRHLVTALFWAFACLASGLGVGFLFGIPRVGQGKQHLTGLTRSQGAGSRQPTADSGSDADLEQVTASAGGLQAAVPSKDDNTSMFESDYNQRVNTNLEEISDWLTKIIVGLGLVELRRIPDHLNSMSAMLARCLGETWSLALASALIVWFSVVGFFIGYLPTRIYLSFVFSIADRMSRDALKFLLAKNANQLVQEKANAVMKNMEADFESRMKINAEELDAVSAGLLALNNPSDKKQVTIAAGKLEGVLEKDKTRARSALILGRLCRWGYNDLKRAIRVLTATIDALQAAGQRDVGYGTLRYNRACYNTLLSNDMDATGRTAFIAREQVGDDLKEAFPLDSDLVELARTDTDLNLIRDADWFKELLAKYPTVPTTEPPAPP